MITEFDILFDDICADVFPKLVDHIVQNDLIKNNRLDLYHVKDYLTDIEGYDSDMATKIWDSFQFYSDFRDLLRTQRDV